MEALLPFATHFGHANGQDLIRFTWLLAGLWLGARGGWLWVVLVLGSAGGGSVLWSIQQGGGAMWAACAAIAMCVKSRCYSSTMCAELRCSQDVCRIVVPAACAFQLLCTTCVRALCSSCGANKMCVELLCQQHVRLLCQQDVCVPYVRAAMLTRCASNC